MSHPTGSRRAVRALAPAALLLIATPAAAQIPDEFTNLQLLPGDISKAELVATMRDWASSLGVRCSHCHVGPDDLQGMDFASDKWTSKRVTREMLILTRAINDEYLKLPSGPEGEGRAVTCYTCHRNMLTPPRAIGAEMARAEAEAEGGGIESAVARFRELHERFYGRGRYDLSAEAVGELAAGLLERGRGEDALRMLELGRELYPGSAEIHAAFGHAFVALEQPERARESFEKALELDRRNRSARTGLRELKSAEQPDR